MSDSGSIIEVENGQVKEKPYQTIVFYGDEHRGAEISNFAAYKHCIVGTMLDPEVDIVAFVGDNAELFLIDKDNMDAQIDDYAKLQDVVIGGGKKNWRKIIETKKTDLKHGIKTIVNGEGAFYRNLLRKKPNLIVLKVFGNHDTEETHVEDCKEIQNSREFRGRFFCDLEAIGKGKFRMLHGHHPHYKKTAKDWPIPSLEDAEKYKKWSKLAYNPWVQALFAKYESYTLSPKNMTKKVDKQLTKWDGTGDYHYLDLGDNARKPFAWGETKHVIRGHTHNRTVKFEKNGKYHYDTGAIVHRKSHKTEDLSGIFKAKLYPDGTLDDIERLPIIKDKYYIQTR